jgi:hypothetical protein
MFPLDFPLGVLNAAQRGQWVLDPFCGRGTTMYAARRRGLGSVGIDTSPVAVAIARAKVAHFVPAEVEKLATELMTLPGEPEDVPVGEFWTYLYHTDTLMELCMLRERLFAIGDERVANVLRAVVLGILHGPLRKVTATYLSNQMPRTYATKPDAAVRYWKKRDVRPPRVDVLGAIKRRIEYTLNFVPPLPSRGEVRLGDARTVLRQLRRRFDWIITSPPYYGMDTYVADQWLRNWFLGGPPYPSYRKLHQISQGGIAGFTTGLSEVWRWVAERSNPHATMAIRFGVLPRTNEDAEGILRASLAEADADWRVESVTDAGVPPSRHRQAEQFKNVGDYGQEIDCIVRLATRTSRIPE